MIHVSGDRCAKIEISGELEWIVTNGIGGYASGTVGGPLTRCYHGLLVAALDPPVRRELLVTALDETLHTDDGVFPLYTDRYSDGRTEPEGFQQIYSFCLNGTVPVWTFEAGNVRLTKSVRMVHGKNTTCVRYRLLEGSAPARLEIRVRINRRGHHGNTKNAGWRPIVEPVPDGLRVTTEKTAPPVRILCRDADTSTREEWLRGFYLSMERYRGLPDVEDHFLAGHFTLQLNPGSSSTFILSAEENPDRETDKAEADRNRHEERLIDAASPLLSDSGTCGRELRQLILAADQFIVKRASGDDPKGCSVLAGYPWFTDWGRDTMIALPGLTLAVGRPEIAKGIIRTFARFIDRGMIPNRFPDEGETPEYNTIDATLWYVEAVRAVHAATGDTDFVRKLYPSLLEIIDSHIRGTRYSIRADTDDSLLYGGENGTQLTWMDAKAGDWVVTPRIGKPVEINALWYNALCVMAGFAALLGQPANRFHENAEKVKTGFDRFWNNETGCLYDGIDGPDGEDRSIRPNQLFAVSLHHTPLAGKRMRSVVDVCAKHLLTPRGLRSLAPDDPSYIGRYGGDRVTRDGAYHQGTVWSWLIGPFASAHYRAYGDAEKARSFLLPLMEHLGERGLGSISEIFDGDPPHEARGCFAQAWGVAEILRVWEETRAVGKERRGKEKWLLRD